MINKKTYNYEVKYQKFAIGYVRVSTKIQGLSGLGLDAQRTIIEKYCLDNNINLIKIYQEVESGASVTRKILLNTIEEVGKINNCILIVAKLDRLTRNLSHLRKIIDEKVNFLAIDFPNQDTFFLSIIALFAEKERDLIRTRIKDALELKKIRGEHMGRLKGSVREREEECINNLINFNNERFLNFCLELKPLLIKYSNYSYINQVRYLTLNGFRSFNGGKLDYRSIKRYREVLGIDNIINNTQTEKKEEMDKKEELSNEINKMSKEQLEALLKLLKSNNGII